MSKLTGYVTRLTDTLRGTRGDLRLRLASVRAARRSAARSGVVSLNNSSSLAVSSSINSIGAQSNQLRSSYGLNGSGMVLETVVVEGVEEVQGEDVQTEVELEGVPGASGEAGASAGGESDWDHPSMLKYAIQERGGNSQTDVVVAWKLSSISPNSVVVSIGSSIMSVGGLSKSCSYTTKSGRSSRQNGQDGVKFWFNCWKAQLCTQL